MTDAPAIEPQFERFGEDALFPFPFPGAVSIRVGQLLASRLQILNAQKDRMIQVQNGRFHFNWKGASGPDYTRYRDLRPEFCDYLRRFQDFLGNRVGTRAEANQWEVTYVNHIPQGSIWRSPDDWHCIFPPLHIPRPLPAGISLETMGGQWQYEIGAKRGRLHVDLRHGRKEDAKPTEVLVLTLTARGPLETDDESGVLRGLDLGHKTIVEAFKASTSSFNNEPLEMVVVESGRVISRAAI